MKRSESPRGTIAHTAPPNPAPNADAATAPSSRAVAREVDRFGHLVPQHLLGERLRAIDEHAERAPVAVADRVADSRHDDLASPRETARGEQATSG